MNNTLPPWMALLFALMFVGLWCGVCLILARFGGWSRLAARFPATSAPIGDKVPFTSAKFGLVRYSNVLSAVRTNEGLYLSIWLPWRLGHPPLFIPWPEMRNLQTSRTFGFDWADVTVDTPHPVKIRLPLKLVTPYLQLSNQASATANWTTTA
jgi:hypothetical protein